MKKRVLAACLWFYTGWFAATFVLEFFNVSQLIGPVVGAIVAALIAGDPMHRIWLPSAAPRVQLDEDTISHPVANAA